MWRGAWGTSRQPTVGDRDVQREANGSLFQREPLGADEVTEIGALGIGVLPSLVIGPAIAVLFAEPLDLALAGW